MSAYLQRNNLTLARLYRDLDPASEGVMNKHNFVTKLSTLNVPGVKTNEYALVFDQLDINNDGALSLNEFGMFVEGASESMRERVSTMEP